MPATSSRRTDNPTRPEIFQSHRPYRVRFGPLSPASQLRCRPSTTEELGTISDLLWQQNINVNLDRKGKGEDEKAEKKERPLSSRRQRVYV